MTRSVYILFCLLLPVFTFGQKKPFKVTTTHLVGNVYVHTSYGLLADGSTFPANGLYVVTGAGIVLIDTPWGEDQTAQLVDLVQRTYKKKILFCISTHFHADRTGGVNILKRHGIKTYSSTLTRQLAAQNGEQQPQFTFSRDTTFSAGDVRVQTFYPGQGHTKDNIVVWLPQTKVLFAGCLIKSLDAPDIGNIKDGNLDAYPVSIAKTRLHFADARYLIPGHQGWKGGTQMLAYTLKLVAQKKKVK
jgi:metallo-beta-lactamase class B